MMFIILMLCLHCVHKYMSVLEVFRVPTDLKSRRESRKAKELRK